ncbi:hypothetical protein BH10PSE11_BH10PSE11_08470 [soil metagenome]
MNDAPSIYEPEFFVAWETFAESISNVFQAGAEDAILRPRATMQTRYVLASMAVAQLLKSIGQNKTAGHFHLLAEAMQDLVDGIDHPLFKIEGPGKPGRPPDSSSMWRERASVCIALEFLVAGGMDTEKAIEFVWKKHRVGLAKLQRTNTDLKKSLGGWLKSFAMDEVTNDVALSSYKEGMKMLAAGRTINSPEQLRLAGERLIAGASERASRIA